MAEVVLLEAVRLWFPSGSDEGAFRVSWTMELGAQKQHVYHIEAITAEHPDDSGRLDEIRLLYADSAFRRIKLLRRVRKTVTFTYQREAVPLFG